jgi:hypothetical protein
MFHPQQSNKCLQLLMIKVEILDIRLCGFICMYCYIVLVSNSQLSLCKPFRGVPGAGQFNQTKSQNLQPLNLANRQDGRQLNFPGPLPSSIPYLFSRAWYLIARSRSLLVATSFPVVLSKYAHFLLRGHNLSSHLPLLHQIVYCGLVVIPRHHRADTGTS